jgi:glycosyltransferase involved in cell wall biosynthesis
LEIILPEKTNNNMNVWILQTGEPLHIDGDSPRPMRAMNLSDKLVDSGHNVVLWSSSFNHQQKTFRSDSYTTYKVHERLEIRLIPSCGYQRHIGIARLFDHFQLAINLKKILKKEQCLPDIAFIGYPPIETASVMSQWLRRRKIPMVLDVKDLWPSMFVDVFPKVIQPFARVLFHPYFYLAKKTINNSTGISTMAPAFLKWVLNFSNRERSTQDKVFRLTSEKGQVNNTELLKAREWWGLQGINETSPKVLFVGTFMSVFDFDPVIDAARNLPNCQFVLCGDGDYLNGVKIKAKGLDNVLFPGWVDRPKVESLANMSLASLAPYKNIENFIVNTPNKIVDSLLLELPILSPLGGEVESLIKDHNVGFTYNYNSLSGHIKSLIDDSKLQNIMSINAKNLYEEEFEFNKVYDGLVDHLECIVKNER